MRIAGGIELKVGRTTFQIIDPVVAANLPVGGCCLKMDDIHIFGEMRNPIYLEALEQIDRKFDIKEWQDLRARDVEYLGTILKEHEEHSGTELNEATNLTVKG
eukprot:7746292-Heterocapsa_arctica.AAC.1